MKRTEEYQSPTGAYMYDFTNTEDYEQFARLFDGVTDPEKYPQLQQTALGMSRARSKRRACEDNTSVLILEGSIGNIRAIGDENGGVKLRSIAPKGASENVQAKIYDSYRLSTEVEISCANATNTNMPLTAAYEPEEDSMAHCLLIRLRNDSTGEYILEEKRYFENQPMRMLEEVTTGALPYEKLAGKSLTLTVDILCAAKDGMLSAVSLASRSFSIEKAVVNSFINKITVEDPHWKNGKQEGNIVFLYGRMTYYDIQGDYLGGDYYKNDAAKGLHTIIPITGTIELNPIKKITGVSIDSYQVGDETFPRSCLSYSVDDMTVIARHGGTSVAEDLGKVLQDNGDLTYDSKTNTAHFDLKLPVTDSMIGPYDWRSSLQNAFPDGSSHVCPLTGCFVLRIEHEPYMGSTVDQYAIYIYSKPQEPGQRIDYYVSGKGETKVYIPLIEICWGCFAKDAQIKTANGAKRAEQIKPGDRIPVLGGRTLTVADVLTGQDPDIFRITTGDGKSTRVSGGHAMLVNDGSAPEGRRTAAARLQVGDRLMTPDGVSVVSEVAREEYNDTVYNFTFEGEDKPNYIEADGFWSGDYHAQNEKQEKKPAQLTEEALALRAELRKFAES